MDFIFKLLVSDQDENVTKHLIIWLIITAIVPILFIIKFTISNHITALSFQNLTFLYLYGILYTLPYAFTLLVWIPVISITKTHPKKKIIKLVIPLIFISTPLSNYILAPHVTLINSLKISAAIFIYLIIEHTKHNDKSNISKIPLFITLLFTYIIMPPVENLYFYNKTIMIDNATLISSKKEFKDINIIFQSDTHYYINHNGTRYVLNRDDYELSYPLEPSKESTEPKQQATPPASREDK